MMNGHEKTDKKSDESNDPKIIRNGHEKTTSCPFKQQPRQNADLQYANVTKHHKATVAQTFSSQALQYALRQLRGECKNVDAGFAGLRGKAIAKGRTRDNQVENS